MPVPHNTLLTALAMTTLAGLSTGLGGLLVLWLQPGQRAVAGALGFAAGVMLTVSFADLLPAGLAFYREWFGSALAAGSAAASMLLCGMALAGLMGRCLPEPAALLPAAQGTAPPDRVLALRCGLTVGLALVLHNLPEGVLTLFAGVGDPRTGLRLTLAIALHNLPEGIGVAAPLWYATRSRSKSAAAAFLSGLAEPVGALAAWGLLRGVLSAALLNGLCLTAAGVMVWVSVEELLFGGFRLGQKGPVCAGFGLGTAVMTLGIAVLA